MMRSTQMNADRFWGLYFRNAFLTLERHIDGYTGRILSEPEQAEPPGGLVRDRAEIPFEVSFDILSQYHYSKDGRFTLIPQRPVGLSEAYERILDQTYPYRDPAPFGKQRMSELFERIDMGLIHNSVAEITLGDLHHQLRSMIEHHIPSFNQPIAALTWFLGERRERSSSSELLQVIQNSSIAPFAQRQIHFTAVDAAFSALWKINDKACLWDLLEIMRYTSESGRRKIAPLFARLLSTTHLLSLAQSGDSYLEPDFWASKLEPYRSFTTAEWDYYDASSLFWELRYLAITRPSSPDIKSLQKLVTDEVGIVREAASKRQSGSSL